MLTPTSTDAVKTNFDKSQSLIAAGSLAHLPCGRRTRFPGPFRGSLPGTVWLRSCLGPVKTETRARARYRTTDRGRTKSSQALVFLAPASSSPSRDQANIQLVCGAVTAQPVENQLARPIRSPPSNRRACVARWSQVIHRYPPLLESWRGNPLTAACSVQSP
jgi:hypothetical protein